MRRPVIGCARCKAVYDSQRARCPCGEPTVLNRMALDRRKPPPSIPARAWWWGLGIAIVMWLLFAAAIVLIDRHGGL